MRPAVYPERSRRGYTLIELLIVISIIAILAVVGFVNFKDFAAEQVAVKAAGQIQSVLRLAQSNATSSTLCGGSGSLSWKLIFNLVNSPTTTVIHLNCRNSITNMLYRSYYFDPAEISSIIGSSTRCQGRYVELTYSVGVGTLTFFDGFNDCIDNSNSLTITVRNKNKITATKNIIISKGGAINVQ